jgi:hypothetical protein
VAHPPSERLIHLASDCMPTYLYRMNLDCSLPFDVVEPGMCKFSWLEEFME